MKSTIATADLKKALSVFKKTAKSLLNPERVIAVRASGGKLVLSLANGAEEIIFHPGSEAKDANPIETHWTTLKSLESALSGKYVVIESDGPAEEDKLRVNGIALEVRNELSIPLPVPDAPIEAFAKAQQDAYLTVLPAVAKPAEDTRRQLYYVYWSPDGMTASNGKILLHVHGVGVPEPRCIPSDPIIPAIIRAEAGALMGIAMERKLVEKDDLSESMCFALYGEKFTYITKWKDFTYPTVRHVMTRADGMLLKFHDLKTPCIPALAVEHFDGPRIELRLKNGTPCIVKDGERTDLDADFDPKFKRAMLRQAFLKQAFDLGITKLHYVNNQWWGENGPTYITFMGIVRT